MDQVSFGAWLAQRRRMLDLTREQLAQCVGCSVSGLRKIEADERRPSRQIAELLARCLQIPPSMLPTFVKVARGVLSVDRMAPALPGEVLPPPDPTPGSAGPSLPCPTTPLIGRDAELGVLARLLRDPGCRLLSLVGPGGIGKTRLALAAAAQHREDFADGVYFVSLAALHAPTLLVPTIADALGFALQGQMEPRAQLYRRLRGKRLLLVLDNVEHLLQEVGLFAEMLERELGLKLLITSRERTNLHGEWVFEVQGLPVPVGDNAGPAQSYSAVTLFIESARRARMDFALQAEEWPAAVRICQMVEGMPLGIELAAAWVSVLTCGEIAQEIERGMDFLATTMRDVPERQRSLRAAFDRSWVLLSETERSVLSRLAIFRGGFDRQAAEQIAGAKLPMLLNLVSKSLVRRRRNGRYDLHEVVRQYALSRLPAGPQADATQQRHSEFYLALFRDREMALKSSHQPEVIRELTDEMANVREAWVWAVEHSQFATLAQALGCFGWFYDMRGWLAEGIEQLELVVRALKAGSADAGRQEVLGQVLAQQGLLLFRQGHFGRALTLCEESLAILRPGGHAESLLDPLLFSGIILFLNGEMDQAQSRLQECLDHALAVAKPWYEAYGLYNLGYIASLLGRYAEGYDQMLAGLAMWRALGDPRVIALGLNHISPAAIKLGRYQDAQTFLQESLALCTQVDDRWGMGTAYRHLGLLAMARGNLAEAQSLIRNSLDLFSGFIEGWDVVRSLVYLGEAVAATGDAVQAQRIFLDALRLAVESRATSLINDALMGLAELQTQDGEAVQALSLSLCVLGQATSTQEARDRATHLCSKLEAQLPAPEVAAARANAQPLERLVQRVLVAKDKPRCPS